MTPIQNQIPLVRSTNPQSAADYHKDGTFQQERALENLSGWSFNEMDRVLDIGSGNGRITCNIAKQVPYGKVVGVDIDPSMCAFASDKYPHTENPNLEFVLGNACELKFYESFDKVTCFATLSWIAVHHHLQIFTGIANALKPGGKALLRMSSEGTRPFNETIGEVIKRDKWFSFFIDFTSPAAYQSEECLKSIISTAGLKVIRIEDVTKSSSYASKDAFYNWLMTWEPHRNRVPEEFRKEFMHEVIDRYCEIINFEDVITITLPGILVEIEKPMR